MYTNQIRKNRCFCELVDTILKMKIVDIFQRNRYIAQKEALQDILSSLYLNEIFGTVIGRAPLVWKRKSVLFNRIKDALHWMYFIIIITIYMFLMLHNIFSIYLESQKSFIISKFIILLAMSVLQIQFYQSVLFSFLSRRNLESRLKLLASIDVIFLRHSIPQNFSRRVKKKNMRYFIYVPSSVLLKFGFLLNTLKLDIRQKITLVTAILGKSYVQNLFIMLNCHLYLRFEKVNEIIMLLLKTSYYKNICLNGRYMVASIRL